MFGFLFLCQFAENDGFQLHPCPCKGLELILFYGCIVFHGVYVPHFLHPVYHGWAFAIVNSAAVNIRVHVSLKDSHKRELGRCPSLINWIKKMWHIYTMEYYAAIKKDEFMSFAGTWIKLETIILSKLIQEQKTKQCMFSLISGC